MFEFNVSVAKARSYDELLAVCTGWLAIIFSALALYVIGNGKDDVAFALSIVESCFWASLFVYVCRAGLAFYMRYVGGLAKAYRKPEIFADLSKSSRQGLIGACTLFLFTATVLLTFRSSLNGQYAVNQIESEMKQVQTRMGAMQSKMEAMEGKMEAMEGKMETMEGKMETMEGKMETMQKKVVQLKPHTG